MCPGKRFTTPPLKGSSRLLGQMGGTIRGRENKSSGLNICSIQLRSAGRITLTYSANEGVNHPCTRALEARMMSANARRTCRLPSLHPSVGAKHVLRTCWRRHMLFLRGVTLKDALFPLFLFIYLFWPTKKNPQQSRKTFLYLATYVKDGGGLEAADLRLHLTMLAPLYASSVKVSRER